MGAREFHIDTMALATQEVRSPAVSSWIAAYFRMKKSSYTVGAVAEEFEEVQVSEDLELLADFVVDVVVLRVEFG